MQIHFSRYYAQTQKYFNFGYRINLKYKGMLSHSFDRFYVVTKFILPTIEDVKFSPIDFDSECN